MRQTARWKSADPLEPTRHELLSTSTISLAEASAPQAAFEVTTLADVVDAADGVLSLREAVELANDSRGRDTISFAESIRGGTITLTQGPLLVTDDLTIDGDPIDRGPSGITIDGGSRGSNIAPGYDAPGFRPLVFEGATGRLEDLTIQGGYGSGISATGSDLAVTRVLVQRIDGSGVEGVGIAITGGSLVLQDSTVGYTGGRSESVVGIRISDTQLAVLDSQIVSNTAPFGYGISGAGQVTIERSTIADNGRDLYALGARVTGTLTITDSVFEGNGTGNNVIGGGIFVDGILAVTNSTVAASMTGFNGPYGGSSNFLNAAIGIGERSTATITNTTLTGSTQGSADFARPGTGLYLAAGSVARVRNSIIDDSVAGPGRLISNGANTFRDAAVAGASPDDQLGVRAEELFVVTAVLGSSGIRAGVAADNGGPTKTVALIDSPTNPALSAATRNVAPALDQRGAPRDATPDIGAFELDQQPPRLLIAISDMALTQGETSNLAFSFSEAVIGFDASDIDVSLAAGAISGFRQSSSNSWIATFTPDEDVEQPANTIGVAAGSYTDIAGNPGGGATSPVFGIDTTEPIPPVTLGPIATDDAFLINAAEVGSKGARLAILANDVAQTGKLVPNSVVLLDEPEGGEATLRKGVLIYKPEGDFDGTETLTYTVGDNGGRISNVATVIIEVTQPPLTQAVADSFVVDGATVGKKGARLDILANDIAGFGKLDPKSIVVTEAPNDGTFTLTKGVVVFQPDAGFEGEDQLVYTVADATGRPSNPATVTIEVTQPPLTQALDDTYDLDAASIGKKGARLDILVNDVPGFGKLDTKSVVITEQPDDGTVTLSKGRLFYQPDPGFDGRDEIRYTVADATGRASKEATVTIDVRQPTSLALADLLDDAPTAIAQAAAPATAGPPPLPGLDTLVVGGETA